MKAPGGLSRAEFARRLAAASPIVDLPARVTDALYEHYEELHRWGPKLDLVGPGTWSELIEKHYAESLAGAAFLPANSTVVDLGSGAGFPGWALAAARPDLEMVLVEARARKCAFLEAVSRRAGVRCRIVNGRVDASLPPDVPRRFAAVTARAIRLPTRLLPALRERLEPGGCMLIWGGEAPPALGPGWKELSRTPLPGGERRYLRRFAPEGQE